PAAMLPAAAFAAAGRQSGNVYQLAIRVYGALPGNPRRADADNEFLGELVRYVERRLRRGVDDCRRYPTRAQPAADRLRSAEQQFPRCPAGLHYSRRVGRIPARLWERLRRQRRSGWRTIGARPADYHGGDPRKPGDRSGG